MKPALYLALIVALIPFQLTLLQFASIGGIRPDLCLVAAILVGLYAGAWEGLALGLALGFIQDQFSAGELWLNLVTKGGAGFLAGRASRYVANASAITALVVIFGFSTLVGLVFFAGGLTGEGWAGALYRLWAVLLPEALYNALVGTAIYWLIAGRYRTEQRGGGPTSLIWSLK